MDNGPYRPASRRDHRRRKQEIARRRLLVLTLVVIVVVAVVAGFVFVARGRGQGPGKPASGATAVAGKTPSAKPAPSSTPTPPPKVWVASKSDPVRVWVGGDSMAGELGWALGPMLDKTKVFDPILSYKESTGICRYDVLDWGKEIDSVMSSARPQATVFMIGTNDTQSVWQDGTWIEWGNPKWKKVYAKRVGDIMDEMLQGGARRVYWVGMPIMGEGWRNPRMKFINKIFQQEAASRPGVEYLDIWDLFATSSGAFDPSLRLSDQVHFTGDGQQKLGKSVLKAIKADWLPAGSQSESPSPTPSGSPTSI